MGQAQSFRRWRGNLKYRTLVSVKRYVLLAAWLGLVPRQHSSGGKPRLQGISKRGDTYLRTLLIHGARSVIRVATGKTTPMHCWAVNLVERRNKNVAAVALANKNARIVWALMTQNREYQSNFVQTV